MQQEFFVRSRVTLDAHVSRIVDLETFSVIYSRQFINFVTCA